MNMSTYAKVVYFDFTGTLFDPFINIKTILNEVAKKKGYKYFNLSGLKQIEKMTPPKLLDTFLVPPDHRKEVVKEVLCSLENEIQSIPPITGIQNVIKQLHSKNHYLGILSSNSKENIVKWLKTYDLDIFHDVICIPFQEEKTSHLQTVKGKFPEINNFLFVSDEAKDLVQAQKAGFETIGVTWGFDSLNALEQASPYCIASKPEDCLESLG